MPRKYEMKVPRGERGPYKERKDKGKPRGPYKERADKGVEQGPGPRLTGCEQRAEFTAVERDQLAEQLRDEQYRRRLDMMTPEQLAMERTLGPRKFFQEAAGAPTQLEAAAGQPEGKAAEVSEGER